MYIPRDLRRRTPTIGYLMTHAMQAIGVELQASARRVHPFRSSGSPASLFSGDLNVSVFGQPSQAVDKPCWLHAQRSLVCGGLLAALGLVAFTVKRSQEARRKRAALATFGARMALVVGGNRYDRLHKLTTCHRDAMDFSQLCSRMGYSVQQLIDPTQVGGTFELAISSLSLAA
jgi:hypothetical protein